MKFGLITLFMIFFDSVLVVEADWIFVTDLIGAIDGDEFYYNETAPWWNDARVINKGENPSQNSSNWINGTTDVEDFLRHTDLCYSPIDGTFSRENCPKPPDCSFNSTNGEAKLCINRVPHPDNYTMFYVMVMKCVPWYINCDKCLCGSISDDFSKWSKHGRKTNCTYTPQNPSDDLVGVYCPNPSTVKVTTIEGRELSFSPPPIKNDTANFPEDLTSSELPPPPDTSLGGITLGGIDLLCSQEYIDAHNMSDCVLICQPGACCFVEGIETCSNNTEGCESYKGCTDLWNTTSPSAFLAYQHELETIAIEAPTKPPFAPLNEISLAPASETLTSKPSKKTKPTAEPTHPTPKPHKPTRKPTGTSEKTTALIPLSISPINVAIGFIGCNVNNYTIQEIKSGSNNEMLSTVEEALRNRSNEVLSKLGRRSLGTFRGNRKLVPFSNVTIQNIKPNKCLGASTSDIISLSGSNCSSCLIIQSNVALSLTGKEGNVVQQDFEKKLKNAVQSEGLGYAGFQDVPVTPSPSQIPPSDSESSSNVNSSAAIGIAFATFAGGYLVIMGLLALCKQHALNTFPSTVPSPSKPSSEPQEKQDISLKSTPGTIAAATAVEAKKGKDNSAISLKEFDMSFSSEPPTQFIPSSVSADPGELVGGSTNCAAVLVTAAPVDNQRPKGYEYHKSSDEGNFIDIGTTDIPPRSVLPLLIPNQENVLTSSTGGPSVPIPSDDAAESSSQITKFTTRSQDKASGRETVEAALMNESCETSSSTQGLRGKFRLSEDQSSDYSLVASTIFSINEEQSSTINSMVEVGDWSGVVLAATGIGKQSAKKSACS